MVLFAVLSILYLGFHGKYFAEYLDDAWVMSYAWNLYADDSAQDLVFGDISGTKFFQRTPALVYGAAGNLLGWYRGVGMAVSKLFVIASSILWYFIIRQLGYKKSFAIAFVGIMLLLDPYFAAANRIRQEPLPLFLCSLSFLLFLKNRYFLSGLSLGLAIESHPFAFTGGMWVLAYLFILWPKIIRTPGRYMMGALLYIFGLAAGFGYWWLLHGSYIEDLSRITSKLTGNTFLSYYFTQRYAWRHWPELFMILISLLYFVVRQKHHQHPFVLPFLIAVVASGFIMSRGNMHYIVYIYPAAILLILTVVQDLKLVSLLIVAFMLYQIPQYSWLFWQQKDYHHREFLEKITQYIPDEPATKIYGNPNAWFAFMDRDFHAYGYYGRNSVPPEEYPKKFYVIETSDFQRWGGIGDLAKVEGLYSREDIAQWPYWDGQPIKIYKMSKIP